MAARTSSQSGPWSSSSTWGGSTPPGNGDTATIAAGHTVTCSANVTIGTSGANGSVAITLAAYTSSVVVATGSELQLRGNFLVYAPSLPTPQLVLNAGSILEFDSSQASSPFATSYAVLPNAGGFAGYFASNGTSGARNIVRSNAGGANGYFGAGGFTQGGSFAAFYTDFVNIGDATTPAFNPFPQSYYQVTVDVENCTFTGCGVVTATGSGTGGGRADTVWKWINNKHTGSASGYTLMLNPYGAIATGGVRLFNGNYFDGTFGADGVTGGDPIGFTITNNFFYVIPQLSGSSGLPWALFQYNLTRNPTGTDFLAYGDILDSYIVSDVQLPIHCHNPELSNAITEFSALRNIWDSTYLVSTPTISNDGIVDQNGTSLLTGTVKNNIVLPCGDGIYGSNSQVDLWGPNTSIYAIENNTICAPLCDSCIDMEYENESLPNGMSHRGTVANNIFWALGSGAVTYAMVTDIENPILDLFDPTLIKTNCRWNLTATDSAKNATAPFQGNSYIGAWSATPGGSDVVGNPNFLDPTRNMATFDAAYLGTAASATWAGESSGHTFSVGDVISDSNSSYYGGATINYRCIQSHVKSTADSEPGVGSAWQTYWEFNTWNSIRNALIAGTLYTDASIGVTAANVIVTMHAWVTKGFAPRNQALKAAGFDGSDIGAVPVLSSSLPAAVINTPL